MKSFFSKRFKRHTQRTSRSRSSPKNTVINARWRSRKRSIHKSTDPIQTRTNCFNNEKKQKQVLGDTIDNIVNYSVKKKFSDIHENAYTHEDLTSIITDLYNRFISSKKVKKTT